MWGFDLEIKYKLGIENKAVNALSRKLQYATLLTVQCYEWKVLVDLVQRDDMLRKIVQELLNDPNAHKGSSLSKGKLYYRERLVVSKNSTRIPLMVKEFHDAAIFLGGDEENDTIVCLGM